MVNAGNTPKHYASSGLEVVPVRDLTLAVSRENNRFHRELGKLKVGTVETLLCDHLRDFRGEHPLFALTNTCLMQLHKETHGQYVNAMKANPGATEGAMERLAEALQLPEVPDGFMLPSAGLRFYFNDRIEAGCYTEDGSLLWYAKSWYTSEGYKIHPIKVTGFSG